MSPRLAYIHLSKELGGGRHQAGTLSPSMLPHLYLNGQNKVAVAEKSAFAYTTALNKLLTNQESPKNRNRRYDSGILGGNDSPAEDFLADLFDPPANPINKQGSQDDQQTTQKIRGLLQAIRDGKRATDIVPDLDDSVRFYILGLSPNAARLSIRFWQTDSIGNLLARIGKHFKDLAIVRQFDNEPEFPPLWRLLSQTATLGKTENVSPVLAGGMARAMLTGNRYPQSLLPVVLERIRTEHSVTYFRAALLKAFLTRNTSDKQMGVSMSLNLDRTDLPYLLGRLFAVLEKAQEEAIPNANATIKDRYISSASATPGQVFHMLLKNSANHIAKLRKNPESKIKGRAVYFDKLSQDIVDKVDNFPTTFKPEEQGLFMIGYYHQRKDFFPNKTQED